MYEPPVHPPLDPPMQIRTERNGIKCRMFSLEHKCPFLYNSVCDDENFMLCQHIQTDRCFI